MDFTTFFKKITPTKHSCYFNFSTQEQIIKLLWYFKNVIYVLGAVLLLVHKGEKKDLNYPHLNHIETKKYHKKMDGYINTYYQGMGINLSPSERNDDL